MKSKKCIMKQFERWLPVPGYPSYLISDHGRIMGMGATKDGFRIIQPYKTKRGYLVADLYSGNAKRGKRFGIQRLVLMAFVGQPQNDKPYASHLDDIKTNNRLDNLAWATPKENSEQAVKNNLFLSGTDHPMAKLSDSDIRFILANYRRLPDRTSNSKMLAAKFGVRPNAITSVVSGTTKHLTKLRAEVSRETK